MTGDATIRFWLTGSQREIEAAVRRLDHALGEMPETHLGSFAGVAVAFVTFTYRPGIEAIVAREAGRRRPYRGVLRSVCPITPPPYRTRPREAERVLTTQPPGTRGAIPPVTRVEPTTAWRWSCAACGLALDRQATTKYRRKLWVMYPEGPPLCDPCAAVLWHPELQHAETVTEAPSYDALSAWMEAPR